MDVDEEDIDKLIRSTVEYVIKHEKEELMAIMKDYKKEVGSEYIDTVNELENLIINWDAGLEVDDLSRKSESSPITLSKQHRMKMLLDMI